MMLPVRMPCPPRTRRYEGKVHKVEPGGFLIKWPDGTVGEELFTATELVLRRQDIQSKGKSQIFVDLSQASRRFVSFISQSVCLV